eukprot:1162136-Pyramimonas_sp.AAC.1
MGGAHLELLTALGGAPGQSCALAVPHHAGGSEHTYFLLAAADVIAGRAPTRPATSAWSRRCRGRKA